jgi:hypothetical protein
MAYVNLSAIRASMCNTPEEHQDHASIKGRIDPSFDLKKATNNEIKQRRLHHFD